MANINGARKFYGWNNAALLFLIQFGASGFVFFAYSAIFPAMVESMGWNRGTASIAHSLGFLMLGLFYPLTAFLIGRWGVRMTLTAGLLVMFAGLLMVIFWVAEVWQWIVAWGLIVGLSFSLTGPICGQTLVIHWFNIRRATVLGLFVTGSAVGGFFAQPILTGLMDYYGSWQSGWNPQTSARRTDLENLTYFFSNSACVVSMASLTTRMGMPSRIGNASFADLEKSCCF